LQDPKRFWKNFHGGPVKSWIFYVSKLSVNPANVLVQLFMQTEELRASLAVKSEECQALITDLQRANTQLSDVDSKTAVVAEKVSLSLLH